MCQQLCINWWSYCWFNLCLSSSPQEEMTTRAGRASGFWGRVCADGWIFRLCVCLDSHRHGYKIQCNVRIKNRELFYCDRKAGRMQGDYFSCYTAGLKTHGCLSAPFLPGFSKLFQQTGSVLVPASSKPPLHLPFWMAALLAKTFYGGLNTNRSKLRVLFSTKRTWCGHSNWYLRRIFGNFTVVGL